MNFCTTNQHPLPQQNRQEPAEEYKHGKRKAVETKHTTAMEGSGIKKQK